MLETVSRPHNFVVRRRTCDVAVPITTPSRLCIPGFPSHNARVCVHRVEDYWRGYKLFCYGYYSHSSRHVQEFRESKLGACISSPPCCSRVCF